MKDKIESAKLEGQQLREQIRTAEQDMELVKAEKKALGTQWLRAVNELKRRQEVANRIEAAVR